MMRQAPREADYVIVGAGAAGCVLAARLSASGKHRVVLLEAGGADRSPILRIPGANFVTGTHPRFNWNYESEAVPGLGGRKLFWAQGRLLGGSSSINGMMYLRGHRRDYDRWSALGCRGWAYDDLLPLFRRSERSERGASPLHGDQGEMDVARGRSTAPVCDLFLDAVGEAGFPVVDDLCDEHAEAFGHVDMTIGAGRRASTSSAFLRRARGRPNLTVLTRSQAVRIVISGGSARAVEYVRDGQLRRIDAEREIALCGGAVNSPQLLMLSGIGPAAHLRQHGIPVIVDAPAVGESLQNHPMYRLLYSTTRPVTLFEHLSPSGLAKATFDYAFTRSGVLSRGLFPTTGHFYANPSDPGSEVQLSIAPALTIRRRPGVLGVLPTEHGFTLLLNHGTPASRGRIELKSADPLAPAAIQPNYFACDSDLHTLSTAVERTRELVFGTRLAAVVGREIQPAGSPSSREEIIADIRATTVTHYHAAGSCRMGGDAGSVVDPNLAVRGVSGLRVADASIMPTLINANTYAAAVMIGEKAADLIMSEDFSHTAE